MAVKIIPKFDNIKFISKIGVDNTSNCWEWFGNINSKGYPRFWINRKSYYAHRISYMLFNAELDNALVIDHICKNTKCVNPEHLRQVSSKVNVTENSESIQAHNKTKTHCINGHEFTKENTKILNGKRKGRACKKCLCENVKRYNKRKRL